MNKKASKNILIAFILNLFFSVFEFFGGILTNSSSILSDSVHDFGDAMSIFISLLLEKKSIKNSDENYTYGYRRYSTLGALLVSGILVISSLLIIYSAIKRIINPIKVHYDGMLLLAIIGVIVNIIAAKITHDKENINEKAVSLHMLEDVLGWIVVLIGSIVIKFTNLYIIDPILSLLVAIFILVNAFKNLKEVFEILLEKKPEEIDLENIKNHVLQIDGVLDVHHIHIWTIDGINNCITLHVLVDKKILIKEIEKLKKSINECLNELNISHSTIEFEIEKCKDEKCNNSQNLKVHSHIHTH